MSEYLSPGVYVEEIDAGPKPIEGVSTSTAGAVGVTARGPDSGKPILITSFADYVRVFGGAVTADPTTMSAWSSDPEKGEFWTFPLAIKGFFDNGGQRIYVRRVTGAGAGAATATLGKGVIAVVTADGDGSAVLKLSSLIGISKDADLTLVVDGVSTPIRVDSYNNAAVSITAKTALPKVKAGRDFVVVRTAGTGAVTLTAEAKGAWGNAISVRAYPMEAGSYTVMANDKIPGNEAATSAIAEAASATKTFKIKAGDGKKFKKDDHVVVDGKPYTLSAVGTDDTLTINEAAPERWVQGAPVNRVRYAAKAGATSLQVWGASSLYKTALIEIENAATGVRRYNLINAEISGNTVTLTDGIHDDLWEGQRIRLIEAHFQIRYRPADGPEQVEDIPNVRLKEATHGDPQHFTKRVTASSRLVNVTSLAVDLDGLDNFPLAIDTSGGSPIAVPWMGLTGGDDALGSLDVDAFVGTDGGRPAAVPRAGLRARSRHRVRRRRCCRHRCRR